MKQFTKKEIIKILQISAKKYNENLLNKNIMFVFEDKQTGEISYIETVFNDYNFMHLTGIKYIKGASEFFKDCIRNKISENNIEIKNPVFTKLKLEVLENIVSINKSAKKIGTYDNNKIMLKIEKVVGNTHCSIGFSNIIQNNKKLKYYYPKTLLQEAFKKNVIKENKVIAIFSKSKHDKLYQEVTYISNKISLDMLLKEKVPEELRMKISIIKREKL